MKKEFLKIAGVKSEKEFYKKYPNEEAFFKAHPKAISQLAKGGEAYPQTATMDNFFSYGVPVPPTYYSHGGAFPMAQPESLFFSPGYGTVYNPYNKAMGGSSEAYPQSMSFPYGATGRSTHFMMQEGGEQDQILEKIVQMLQQGIEPQQVVEELINSGLDQQQAVQTVQAVVAELSKMQQPQQEQAPMIPSQGPSMEQVVPMNQPPMAFGGDSESDEVPIGVNGRLSDFTKSVKSKATSIANSNLGQTSNQMKKGGHISKFQIGGQELENYRNYYRSMKGRPEYANISADQLALAAYQDYYLKTFDALNDPNNADYTALRDMYKTELGNSSNTNNSNSNQPFNLNNLGMMSTPFGRIKRKGWVNGEFGRGRGNQYMWQTMFNTDNFAQAQAEAAKQGLRIDEGSAGLFGKRKKYTYDWTGQGQNQGTGTGSNTGQGQGPGTGSNQGNPTTGQTLNPPTVPPDMNWLARRRYRKSGFQNQVGPSSGTQPGTPGAGFQMDPYESKFDPRGSYAGWSEAKNQRIQNKRRRIGQKLDDLFMRNQYYQDLNNDPSMANTSISTLFEAKPRLDRKYNRLMGRYDKTNVSGSSYSDYQQPEKKEYGGYLPQARYGVPGLGNTIFEKEGLFGRKDPGRNNITEKDSLFGYLSGEYGGMDKYERRQNIKNIGSNLIGNYINPINPLLPYASAEATYNPMVENKGQFNPINGLNTPYDKMPARYDNYTSPSLLAPMSAQYGGAMAGDIRYMTDDEIEALIQMGGQVEFLD